MTTKKAKKSERATKRAAWIKAGKCGTCGKRKLATGRKECRVCLDKYNAYARKAYTPATPPAETLPLVLEEQPPTPAA